MFAGGGSGRERPVRAAVMAASREGSEGLPDHEARVMRPVGSAQMRTRPSMTAERRRGLRRRASAMEDWTLAAYQPHLLALREVPPMERPVPPEPAELERLKPSGAPSPLMPVPRGGGSSAGLAGSGLGSSLATGVCSTIFGASSGGS